LFSLDAADGGVERRAGFDLKSEDDPDYQRTFTFFRTDHAESHSNGLDIEICSRMYTSTADYFSHVIGGEKQGWTPDCMRNTFTGSGCFKVKGGRSYGKGLCDRHNESTMALTHVAKGDFD